VATTPYLDSDDSQEFSDYEAVIKKIKEIYDETESYINNSREEKLNYKQMALEFAKVDGKAEKLVNKVEIDSMTEEEQRELCMKILQDQGAVILMPETADENSDDF
jgi:predicted transcriptional regulator